MASLNDVLSLFEKALSNPATTHASLGRIIWTHRIRFLEAMRMAAARPKPRDWDADCRRYWGRILTGERAHWCPDCKAEAPVLAKLMAEFGGHGLVLIGPTQRYGYIENGEEAGPQQETRYIDEVRRQFYGALEHMTVPISEDNFKNYGASTTPTIVLVDRKGVVRLYHPGAMSYEALAARVRQIIRE